ncbi:hypothetical protein D9M71_541780 [compost metagenome]
MRRCLAIGTELVVQVRAARNGVIQAVIGIYEGAGEMMVEEYYASLPGETMSSALVWGVKRARALAPSLATSFCTDYAGRQEGDGGAAWMITNCLSCQH